MSTSGLSTSPATVVDMSEFRSTGNTERSKQLIANKHEARMLSMRRHLSYQASVEIDNLETIFEQHGEAVRSSMVKQVRALLDKEFGKLRVHRYRRVYVIRHRSVEGLISSLLRVQFHAHQLELPLLNKHSELVEEKPVTLTWGVGRTTTEAEVERLRRRRQKMRR